MSPITEYTELKTKRFERKFVFQNGNIAYALHLVKMNPGGFSEIYQQRQINNIYFDTHNLNNYYDNHLGKSNRVKIRIRWYGETYSNIETPILEFKIKNGLIGRKLSFKLIPFAFTKSFSSEDLFNVLKNSDLPEWVLNDVSVLQPTLLNTYTRRYFQSFDRKYRFTIDFNMHFYNFQSRNTGFLNHARAIGMVVLELKYDMEHDSSVNAITSPLPFRLDKFSKYVTGVEYFNSHLAI